MIDTTFGLTILASIVAGMVTTIGIYVISRYEAWGRHNIVYFMSCAACVLISVSLLYIVDTMASHYDAKVELVHVVRKPEMPPMCHVQMKKST